MPAETPPEMSPAKVRIGLAIIGVVLAVALLLVVVIDSTVGKAVMFAIAVTALVRAFLLYRSLRREQPAR
jgi:hypothetical protein